MISIGSPSNLRLSFDSFLFKAGTTTLSRLARFVSPSLVYKEAIPIVAQLIKSNNKYDRKAALAALTLLVFDCAEFFEADLEKLLPFVPPLSLFLEMNRNSLKL